MSQVLEQIATGQQPTAETSEHNSAWSIKIVATADSTSHTQTYKVTDEQLAAAALALVSAQASAKSEKSPTIPTVAPLGQEYVDPYLFEIGHFKDRAEYEELSRTAKIKSRSRA